MHEAAKPKRELSPSNVVTPPCRLAFPALFKPKPRMKVVKPDEKVRLTYQAVVLMPPEVTLEPFYEAMKFAMTEKWGKIEKLPGDRNPIRDAGDKAGQIDGYEAGWKFINCHSGYAPAVVDRRRQPIIEPELVYAGCWCRFHLNAFAWDYGGKKGVSFSLNAVQFDHDDDRLDGRANVEDVFEALEDSGSAPDGDASNIFGS